MLGFMMFLTFDCISRKVVGHSFYEYVGMSTHYIPSVDSLCDREGHCRFTSLDEYREYYYSLQD